MWFIKYDKNINYAEYISETINKIQKNNHKEIIKYDKNIKIIYNIH